MPNVDLRGVSHPRTHSAVFDQRDVPVGIFREQSASAVDNLDTCRAAARSRTRVCRLDHRAGIYSLTAGLFMMVTAVRETPNRSGHHPYRSVRTSSGLIVIYSYCIISVIIISKGKGYHVYSHTTNYIYRVL